MRIILVDVYVEELEEANDGAGLGSLGLDCCIALSRPRLSFSSCGCPPNPGGLDSCIAFSSSGRPSIDPSVSRFCCSTDESMSSFMWGLDCFTSSFRLLLYD